MGLLSIAVAGCGPAGLATALFLARDGHRVTIFDQMAAPGAVGSGLLLQQTGLAVLAELGLDGEITAHAAPVRRLLGTVEPSGRKVLDVRFETLGPGSGAFGLHRAALFDVLFRGVARAGVPVVTAFRVAALDTTADGRPALIDGNGRRTGPFDLVVDALGSRSPLAAAHGRDLAFGALWTNLPWPGEPFRADTLEQRYRRADTMAGVMPIGRPPGATQPEAALFWSMPRAAYPAWQAAGLSPWREALIALWPEIAPLALLLSDPDQLVFARYRHHTMRRPAGLRVVHVGDAAHATSPQLGQGANMALLDARAVALAIERHADLDEAFRVYMALRRYHVRLYQTLSLLFTPVYQSHSRVLPLLRDRLFAPVSRLPGIAPLMAALVAGTLIDPRRRLALAPPQP